MLITLAAVRVRKPQVKKHFLHWTYWAISEPISFPRSSPRTSRRGTWEQSCFRTPKTLTFKTRLSAKMSFVCMSVKKKIPKQRLCTQPRFETEAWGNSETAFWSMFCWHRRFHINRKRCHKIYKFSQNLFWTKICSLYKRLKGII